GAAEAHQQVRFAWVHADRATKGIETFVDFAEAEAEVGVKLHVLAMAGGRGEQFLAGSECFVGTAELRFELRNALEVVAPATAVGGCQTTVQCGSRPQIAGLLVDACSRCEGRN